MFFALFILYATRYLHVNPGLLGLVLGIGAIGGVLGALVTKRLAARLGVGRVYTISCLVFTAPLVLVPLAGGPRLLVLGMLMAAEFISGFGVMVLDISIGAIFSAVIPDELRSRVSGAFQAVNYGTRPLGALAGGFLGTLIGPRPTLWVAAIGGMSGFLLLLPTPLPRFRMPASSKDEARTGRARQSRQPRPGRQPRLIRLRRRVQPALHQPGARIGGELAETRSLARPPSGMTSSRTWVASGESSSTKRCRVSGWTRVSRQDLPPVRVAVRVVTGRFRRQRTARSSRGVADEVRGVDLDLAEPPGRGQPDDRRSRCPGRGAARSPSRRS